jgi:hypothetical protein
MLAVVEFCAPSVPPFKGRCSFLYKSGHSKLGAFGVAYAWLALSLLLLLSAFIAWRARSCAKAAALSRNAL